MKPSDDKRGGDRTSGGRECPMIVCRPSGWGGLPDHVAAAPAAVKSPTIASRPGGAGRSESTAIVVIALTFTYFLLRRRRCLKFPEICSFAVA